MPRPRVGFRIQRTPCDASGSGPEALAPALGNSVLLTNGDEAFLGVTVQPFVRRMRGGSSEPHFAKLRSRMR